jgi:hypothetical protein
LLVSQDRRNASVGAETERWENMDFGIFEDPFLLVFCLPPNKYFRVRSFGFLLLASLRSFPAFEGPVHNLQRLFMRWHDALKLLSMNHPEIQYVDNGIK